MATRHGSAGDRSGRRLPLAPHPPAAVPGFGLCRSCSRSSRRRPAIRWTCWSSDGPGGRSRHRLDQARRDPLDGARARAGAAEVDPAAMGPLRTLGQIVDFLQARLPRPRAVSSPPPTAAQPASPAAAARSGAGAAHARGRRGEDGLSVGHAGPLDGPGGRSRHRLDQARRDPLDGARARAGPPEARSGRDGTAAQLGQIVALSRGWPPAAGTAVAAAPVAAAESARGPGAVRRFAVEERPALRRPGSPWAGSSPGRSSSSPPRRWPRRSRRGCARRESPLTRRPRSSERLPASCLSAGSRRTSPRTPPSPWNGRRSAVARRLAARFRRQRRSLRDGARHLGATAARARVSSRDSRRWRRPQRASGRAPQ